mmetsp:Transcript_6380/g.20715  ORF Transcript_6380/g.20715 Transcript_6380/m.20715 type:complete len:374 (-) Transcript_6380:414-1535(-)
MSFAAPLPLSVHPVASEGRRPRRHREEVRAGRRNRLATRRQGQGRRRGSGRRQSTPVGLADGCYHRRPPSISVGSPPCATSRLRNARLGTRHSTRSNRPARPDRSTGRLTVLCHPVVAPCSSPCQPVAVPRTAAHAHAHRTAAVRQARDSSTSRSHSLRLSLSLRCLLLAARRDRSNLADRATRHGRRRVGRPVTCPHACLLLWRRNVGSRNRADPPPCPVARPVAATVARPPRAHGRDALPDRRRDAPLAPAYRDTQAHPRAQPRLALPPRCVSPAAARDRPADHQPSGRLALVRPVHLACDAAGNATPRPVLAAANLAVAAVDAAATCACARRLVATHPHVAARTADRPDRHHPRNNLVTPLPLPRTSISR